MATPHAEVEVLLPIVATLPGRPALTWKGHIMVQTLRLRESLRALTLEDRQLALEMVGTMILAEAADIARASEPLPF
jgi:hypothetical protein